MTIAISARRATGASIESLLSAGVIAVSTFAPMYAMAVELGPETYGTVAPYATLQALLQMLIFGPLALSAFVYQSGLSKATTRYANPVKRSATSIGTLVQMVFLAGVFASGQTWLTLCLVFFSIGTQQGVASVWQQSLLADGRRLAGAAVLSAGNAVRLLVIVVPGVSFDARMHGLVMASAVVSACLWLIQRSEPQNPTAAPVRWLPATESAKGAPFMWAQTASDRWSLRAVNPGATVASYAVHSQFAAPITILADAVVQLRSSALATSTNLHQTYKSSLKLFAMCAGICTLAMWIAGTTVMSMLFGDAYPIHSTLLIVMTASNVLAGAGSLAGTALILAQRERSVRNARIVLAILNVAITFAVARFGVVWVAGANLAFVSAQITVFSYQLARLP